jgi:hypothetical protein
MGKPSNWGTQIELSLAGINPRSFAGHANLVVSWECAGADQW